MNNLGKKAKRPLPNGHFASRVLVVDDEAMITEEIAELLGDDGFACDRASHGRSALEMVLNDPSIAVVVTDLKMPGMDGLELIRKINSSIPAYRDLAVIVVTGHAGTAEAIEALRLGAMDFLTKPIDPDHLVHAVRRADETLNLRRLERHFQEQLKVEVRQRTAEVRNLASELEEANAALTERNRDLTVSNRVKDDFLALISHELRTPLTTIIGFSEIMAEGDERCGEDTEKGCSRKIAAAGKKLLRIVNTILELIDIESGELKLNKSSIDAADLIGRVVEVFEPKAGEKPITLTASVCRPLPLIDADAHRVMQALGNVVENAIHFSPPGSEVRIGAIAADDRVIITVTDHGDGMTKEETLIAGEAFRQVDANAAKNVYGIGLGLPLARLFIELHGGDFEIESDPGAGTTVRMTLPAAANGQD